MKRLAVLVLAFLIHIQFANAADQYDLLRQKWYDYLTGGKELNSADVKDQVTDLAASARKYWNSMNKKEDRKHLWDELALLTIDKNCHATYSHLREMALAFRTIGSPLKDNALLKKDIIDALDWMYANRYNGTTKQENNWWYWWFGIPLALNDCITLMYDDLSTEQVANYMKGIDHFCHLPMTHSGANRMWECTVIGIRSILLKDSAGIAASHEGMKGLFEYVTSGNGFYRDGSCIQHTAYAYTGGYGISLLKNMAEMMFLLSGSAWDTNSPEAQNVYRWVYDAFEPIMYKGGIMSMVQGREIGRIQAQEHHTGHKVISAVALLAQAAPPSDSKAFKSMVKEWISKDTYRDYFADAPVYNIVLAKKIMNDRSIPARGDLMTYRQYSSMDRAVIHRPGYSFAISMFSGRIANYEQINDENFKAWHTGSGMTYLYNELSQYDDNFWPTVDSHRIPGTTVVANTTDPPGKRGSKNWVGGTNILDIYGITGMEYKSASQTLTAKKSWFMFDDEIVALGAGITGTDNKPVETIIENRKLNNKGNNKLTINGKSLSGKSGWSEDLKEVKWAHLMGNTEGTADGAVGYVFPSKASVKGLREQRTDSWGSINKFGDSTAIIRNYFSLSFDHGTNPTNSEYCYILLPNKTSTQVGKYEGNPDIIILENSTEAQAVKEKKLNITGINFWNDTEKKVDFFACNKKASVIVMENKGIVDVSVSDPTQKNSGTIDLLFDRKAAEMLSADSEISIISLSPLKISVNVHKAYGKTFKAKFRYK